MLSDVTFFSAKLGKIEGFGDSGDYLINIAKHKQIESQKPATNGEVEKEEKEEKEEEKKKKAEKDAEDAGNGNGNGNGNGTGDNIENTNDTAQTTANNKDDEHNGKPEAAGEMPQVHGSAGEGPPT